MSNEYIFKNLNLNILALESRDQLGLSLEKNSFEKFRKLPLLERKKNLEEILKIAELNDSAEISAHVNMSANFEPYAKILNAD